MNAKTILISLMFLPLALWAAPFELASFGGDYVSSNQDSQASLQDILGTPTASDSIRQIGGFSVSAHPSVNYTGPDFFAGAQAVKIGVNANNGLAEAEISHGHPRTQYHHPLGNYLGIVVTVPPSQIIPGFRPLRWISGYGRMK